MYNPHIPPDTNPQHPHPLTETLHVLLMTIFFLILPLLFAIKKYEINSKPKDFFYLQPDSKKK